jgi:predicted lipase
MNIKQELLFSSLRSRQSYENRFEKFLKIDNTKFNINKYSLQLKYNKFLREINKKEYKPIVLKNNNGYIINDDNNLYITFRGTSHYSELLNSINTKAIQLFKFSEAKVHAGFGELFLDFKEELSLEIKNILDSYNIKKIVFSGHSKGGSLSSIASLYYACKLNNYSKLFDFVYIANHTFGTPVTGDENFVKLIQSHVDENFRIENEDDIVPYIPLNKNFKHIPISIKFTNESKLKINDDTILKSPTDLLLFAIKERDEVIFNHSCDKYIENMINILY